jgi:hypothetical protein
MGVKPENTWWWLLLHDGTNTQTNISLGAYVCWMCLWMAKCFCTTLCTPTQTVHNNNVTLSELQYNVQHFIQFWDKKNQDKVS